MAVKTCLKPPMSIISASGDVCSFKALQSGLPLKVHKIAITATQSGSGTPSPDNVRPISGYNAINISQSGADISNPTVHTIQIGSTVYGGEYDAITGLFQVTHGIVDLSSLNWDAVPLATERFAVRADFAPRKYGTDIVGMCDSYDFYGSAITTNIKNNIQSGQFAYQTTRSYVWIRDDRFSDTESLIASLSGKYLVYELATPTTIQLPPCPIDTLEGVNNIWADTGNTSLEAIKIGR